MKFCPGVVPPVSQQHVLHIGERQRPFQQRIVVEIDLADRQIVGGAPVGVDLVEQARREGVGSHGLSSPGLAEIEDAGAVVHGRLGWPNRMFRSTGTAPRLTLSGNTTRNYRLWPALGGDF